MSACFGTRLVACELTPRGGLRKAMHTNGTGVKKQVFAGQVSFLRLKNVDSLSCLKLRKRAIVE